MRLIKPILDVIEKCVVVSGTIVALLSPATLIH